MRSRADLREQQHDIARNIFNRPYLLVISHMGSGKTVATLTALVDLINIGDVRRVLVVAPKRVAKDVWPEEIKEWAHTRGLSVALCVGTQEERKAAIAKRAQVTIINRNNLTWLWQHIGGRPKWDWDCLVVDESSMFKSGSRRSAGKGKLNGFGVLASARQKVSRVVELSGTPSPNGEIDLWGQMYLLDLGYRLGNDKSSFLKRWFDENSFQHTIKIKPGAAEEIQGLIADLTLSLPKLDVIPEPVFIPVRVKLSTEHMKEYRRFERTLVSQLYDVEAVSRGVLTNKLLQFANGGLYRERDNPDGPPIKEVVEVHDAKVEALADLIEEADGDNVLIFYSFKFDLARLRKRFPEAVVLSESPTAVQDWNAGKIRILLAHPANCAHGLNLQYGGHIAVWYGFNWSLELYLQANARLPRPGQTHVVAIYQIIAEGTMDEAVLETLSDKNASQQSLMNALIDRLTGLTGET